MRRSEKIRIQPLGFESPVERAAQELARYLPRLAPVKAEALGPRGKLPEGSEAEIVVGTSGHMAGLVKGALPRESEWDDAVAIIPEKGRLFLVGANPRSVLFAAYRLLEELGVVFLRPGPNGEVVPRQGKLALPRRAIREKASYRHRGVCIEGAPRLEHVLEMLDWMAKKKMNAFQLQFHHAGVFWRRGYGELEGVGDADLPAADCYALDDRVIQRVRELGMKVHRVGHGWTAATVGLEGTDWVQTSRTAAAKESWLAEVGGERAIWQRIPANTELCYSKAEVREAFVEQVVAYARRHSEVDLLHVWMSDSYNNKCECAGCRRRTPSGWYAMLVGEIARRLEEEKLETKVVFLGYMDLLWPPKKERIEGENVVFMYAPITRCYRHALADGRCDGRESAERPGLNRCRLPQTNRAYAKVMREWKKLKLPDTFVFDYHMMWAVWADGLGRDVGAVMAQDIKDLGKLGLNGFMSCQATRAFYPLPYAANAMGDLLWDKERPGGAHRRKIMGAAFGKHAAEVERYFARLVRMFRAGEEYEHGTLGESGGKRGRWEKAAGFAEEWKRRLSRLARGEKDRVVRTSLEVAAIHADQVRRIARARLAGLDGNRELIRAMQADHRAALPGVLRDYSWWVDPLVGQPVEMALAQAEREARG